MMMRVLCLAMLVAIASAWVPASPVRARMGQSLKMQSDATGPGAFFVPAGGGGGGGGIVAKDALGDDVTVKGWKDSHTGGARELVQGLKGDATYLILDDDKNMADFAVNAVCTHLGCVVPWNKAENKFMCPCHGSQYDKNGKVVRGPAPLSLTLAKRGDQDGTVVLSAWTETDFRDGNPPWWKP